MPNEIVVGPKGRELGQIDVNALAHALMERGDVSTSGDGATSVGGDAINSSITNNVFKFEGGNLVLQLVDGKSVPVTDEFMSSLGAAVRSKLPPILNNLPTIARSFTGRVEEERAIINALVSPGANGSAVSAISSALALKGVGGVGKTALAVKVAHNLTGVFPEAQIYIDLRGTSDAPVFPRAAMENVLQRFYPGQKLPDDEAAVGELYRQLLSNRKCLLVLDNARDAGQVEPLLPPAPSAAIVTSRRLLAMADVLDVSLDNLPLEDAQALARDLMAPMRILSEDDLTRLVDGACRRHPLSVKVAALYLRAHKGRGVGDYIASVEADRRRLKLDGQTDSNVMAVLELSVTRLREERAALAENWRSLFVFPGDFDGAAAAAVWDAAERDVAIDDLTDLEGWGLLDAIDEDRYRLHDLLRDVARMGCSAAARDLAMLRHASHYVGVLWEIDALYQKGGASLIDGLGLFDREWGNIAAGQSWAAGTIAVSQDAARLAAGYANAGVYLLNLRLHPRDWINWSEAALGGNRAIGDRGGEGATLGNLGLAYAALGETRKAIEHYEQQLVITREIGDRGGEGNALGNLGLAYAALGETRKAIEHYEQRIAIAREIGDRGGEGATLGNLGNAYAALGETRKALEHHEQYLTIAREIGDRRGEGATLGNLGLAYADLGETQKAIEHYEQLLAIAREIGDRRGEGAALGNLGLAYARLGETRKAIEHHEQALIISREIGDRRAEGQDLGNLGIAYKNLGETRKAIEHYEQQLVITREIGDRRGEGNALTNLGLALKDNDPAATRDHWRKALAIFTQIEDPNAARVSEWLAALDGTGTAS